MKFFLIPILLLLACFSEAQRNATINRAGAPSSFTINEPGAPSTATINRDFNTYVVGEQVLSGSSGLSKAEETGDNNNFDFVSISDYTRVKIAGAVDRVRFYLAAIPAGTFTDYIIRVWRKDGATYDLIGEVTIAKAALVAGVNEHVNSSPFNVLPGDYVGIAIVGDQTNNVISVSRGASGVGRFNLTYPNSSTNMNWDGATAATVYCKIQLIADANTYAIGRRGVIIGNSTVADKFTLSTIGTAISDFVFTEEELRAGYQALSIAKPGDDIDDQRAAWNALTDHTQYSWVTLQIGINDMSPAEPASSALARYQTLVNDIRADAPDIIIIVSKMMPARGRWPALYPGNEAAAQAKYEAMHVGMLGGGPNAITGVDAYIGDYHTIAADVDGYLLPEYDSGDGVHENDLLREIIGVDYYRAKLIELGLLQ